MEIKEIKRNNHNWVKELVIILVGVLLLAIFSLRADAAENDWTGTFESNGNTYVYYYTNYYHTGYTYVNYSTNVYVCLVSRGNTVNYWAFSREPFTMTDKYNTYSAYQSTDANGVIYYGYSGNISVGTVDGVTINYPQNGDSWESVGGAFVNHYFSEDFVGYQVPVEETDMALTGFECNEYMEAFWTGISGLSGYSPGELVVEVKPTYVLMLEEGEELQPFEKPGVINVPFEDMCFSNTYDYYFEGNPYKGRAILTLNFTPVFTPNQTNEVVYRGKTIKVTFDKNGEFGGYDIPVDGLVPEYSDIEFVLNNFTAISQNGNGLDYDCYIQCLWNGSSIDGLIDYVYSEIKVEIYCWDEKFQKWIWLEYPLEKIVTIKTNRLDLDLYDMAEYALSKDVVFKDAVQKNSMFKDCMIRITPYYKGYSEYVYGKSIVITTTSMGGIKVVQQSNGNGFVENPMYQELGKDYFDDHSPVGDYMDSILDGFDESEMNLDKVTLNFFTLLKGLLSATGQFPAMFAAVFSFLPDYFISMIVVSLSLIIILRVIGR